MQLIFDAIVAGFEFIISFFYWIVIFFVDMVAKVLAFVINVFIELIRIFIEVILFALPDSPFLDMSLENVPGIQYLGYLDFVIPFKTILNTTSIWLVAILVYYGLRVILNVSKVKTQ